MGTVIIETPPGGATLLRMMVAASLTRGVRAWLAEGRPAATLVRLL
jgi:hypothetical protein